MGLTSHIVDRMIPERIPRESSEFRGRVGALEGWFSVFGNLILFVIKFIFGMAAHSIALIADAFHTLSDVATSAVVIFGFRVAQKPADREHPFGHGRAETIATLTIAILMAVVGIEFLKGAVNRLFFSDKVVDVEAIDLFFLGVVTLTALAKAWMARFAYQLGDLIDSDTLRGDAVHHKSDVYTTVLVLAGLIGVQFGLPALDGIIGIGVAFMILWSAYELARGAIDELLGTPASSEFMERIAQLAISIEGAQQVHDVMVHKYGDQHFISLHIEIDEKTEPGQAHTIADQVEQKLARELNAEVVTHIDPVSLGGARVDRVRGIIEEQLREESETIRCQDLRVVGQAEIESILFEVAVPAGFREKDHLETKIRKALAGNFPKAAVILEFHARHGEVKGTDGP